MKPRHIGLGATGIRYGAVLLFALIFCAAGMCCLAGCDSAKSEAQNAFKQASEALAQKNASVDDAIAAIQEVMGSEVGPLDAATMTAADEAISAAQAAKVEVPEIASEADAINKQAEEMTAVDYSEQLSGLAKSRSALEKSIKQHEQVINPSEAFILERLANVKHVKTPTAATEDNDPNTLLHKQGGYDVSVFFDTDLFDSSGIPEAYGVGVVGKGVEGGGEVEVYADEAGAQARDQYLAGFDGTMLSPGSHYVVGSVVIRASEHLTASQQKELTQAIIDELVRLD